MGITNDWKRLNVWDFRDELWIGNRRDFPANLTLMKMVNTDFIYASFLPEEQDDPRERERDSQGRKKKRRPFLKSTKTNIPQQAARVAIDGEDLSEALQLLYALIQEQNTSVAQQS